MTVAKDAEMMINARIAQIDHLLSIQLNEILHHPSFQKLEGIWRGLKYLMDQSETGTQLKIRVLNAQQEGAAAATSKRRRSSIRARCSRRSTKKSTASSAARRSARWSATTNSASIPKTWSCWRGFRTWRRRRTRRSSARQLRTCSTWRASPSLDAPARPGQDLRHHRIRQVEVLPPERRFPLRGAVPAAHPVAACRTARTPSRWKSSTTKSTWTAPITPSICG